MTFLQPVELLGSPLSEYEALFPHLPRHQVLALFRFLTNSIFHQNFNRKKFFFKKSNK